MVFAIETLQRVFSQDYQALLIADQPWPAISLFGREWLPGALLTWAMPLLLGLAGLLVLKLARRQWLRLLDDEPAAGPVAQISGRRRTIMSRAILQLRDVHKSFGEAHIIRGAQLELHTGERHAVIGPNGAGKSTLFHLISSGCSPAAGRFSWVRKRSRVIRRSTSITWGCRVRFRSPTFSRTFGVRKPAYRSHAQTRDAIPLLALDPALL